MDTDVNPSATESRGQARRPHAALLRGHTGSRGPGSVIDSRVHIGDAVVNPAGDDLGKIEAIMLDVASGQIAYAVLSFGGFLGLGSKFFALPWVVLTLDAGKKRFILDASKDKLEKAEGFDKDNWPSMADPDWALRLHSHYNVPPYWREEHAAPVSPALTDSDPFGDAPSTPRHD